MKRIKEARRYKDHDKDVRNKHVATGNTAKWQGGWVEMFALVDFHHFSIICRPHVRACPPCLESRARPKEILTYILERRFLGRELVCFYTGNFPLQ